MKKKYIIMLSFLFGIIFFISFIFASEKKVYFSLEGKELVELSFGSKYKENGFNAQYCSKYLKMFCKDISKNVKISKREIESKNKVFINYNLVYKDINKVLTREVLFVDKESPTIELVDNNVAICPNQNYVEEGYRAYDNIDGDLTDSVETYIKGNKMYYSVSDKSGNKKIIYRDIKYVDNEKPNISLVGGDKNYIFVNQEYVERGFIASDNCDGNISDKVVIENKVDTSKKGEYEINYSIVDTMGNKNIITRKIIVYDDESQVPKNGKVIYLTFDDGPGNYTESILNVLNKYNVKATFFVTNQFSKYQGMIKKEYDSGHSIAVHTYSHNYGNIYSSVDSYINDFNYMNQIIFEQTGMYSKIFRFPGGSSNTISKFNKGVLTNIANKMTELGYYYFDWNVDSTDTSTKDPEEIYQNVIKEVEKRDNSVVLLHDIKKANIESVEKIIIYGLNNGYTFLPLTETSPTVHHHINN